MRQAGLTERVASSGVSARSILAPGHAKLLERCALDKANAAAAVKIRDGRLIDAIRKVHAEGGYSYEAIGRAVGLTKQRIDQILRASSNGD